MKDSYLHKGLRRKLVEQIREKGIRDEAVLHAIATLPRHFFLDAAFAEHAYQDKAFPIGKEQTISQPYTVAFQTQLLAPQPKEKILEVGTGSGYQAGILALMGARVFTVERHASLYKETSRLLDEMGLGHIRTFHRDGYKGLPEHAPFDGVIITAATEDIPQALFDQIRPGGRMVVPYGSLEKGQRMLRIEKGEDGKPHIVEEGPMFRFVPFRKGLE